jgi:hypothetical protein
MLKVRVRFDKVSDTKTLKLDGYAEKYPEVGKEFSFYVPRQKDKIFVDLGKVYNTKSYGDMLLVQTDLVVAEVWILSGEVENNAEIIPLTRNNKSLLIKGNKITTLRKRPLVKGSLSRLKNLLALMKEDSAFSDRKPKTKLFLIREEENS